MTGCQEVNTRSPLQAGIPRPFTPRRFAVPFVTYPEVVRVLDVLRSPSGTPYLECERNDGSITLIRAAIDAEGHLVPALGKEGSQ